MANLLGARRRQTIFRTGCLISAFVLVLLLPVGGFFSYLFYFFAWRYDVPIRIAGHYEKYGVAAAADYTIAPNSKTIVYSSSATGHGDLWTMDREGKNSKQRTANPDFESGPSYSPDGRQIVFFRETDKCGHIWIMNPDGTGATQLTFGPDYDADPIFTLDGQNIWFYRTPRGTSTGHYTLFTMSASGKNIQPLNVNIPDRASDVCFAPDGKWVYFLRADNSNPAIRNQIWRMRLDGTGLQSFTDGSCPAVSADSKEVAFVLVKRENELWMMEADGSRKRLVYSSNGFLSRIAFSADGHSLFFLEGWPKGADGIFISTVNTDGSAYHRLKDILR